MRIGWIDYLNTLPFNFEKTGIGLDFRYSLVKGVPSTINRLLSEDSVDVGFISSAHYLENWKDYLILPDLSISSLNRVQSVIILSDRPIESIDKIYLTGDSKTSRYLTKIIFELFLKTPPEYKELEDLHALEEKEAVLLIGDSAIKYSSAKKYSYDLSSIWYRETGLPFVFALWCVRKEYYKKFPERVKSLHKTLKLSKNRFFENINSAGLSEDKIQYLKNLDYCLSSEHLKSLELFSEYLMKIGILRQKPEFNFI
ncbi:menaquinone biosynthetic enzyme MqnA/MqnD family protein [Persephonella sp.]